MSTIDTVDVANRLRPVLLRLARSLRREALELGVTGGQASVLGTILAYPELGVGDLAVREGMSAPAMSRYLDRLETAGLLARVRDVGDRRRVRLVVTADGQRIVEVLRTRRNAWLAARLEGLPDADLATVVAAIDPLLRLLEDDG